MLYSANNYVQIKANQIEVCSAIVVYRSAEWSESSAIVTTESL